MALLESSWKDALTVLLECSWNGALFPSHSQGVFKVAGESQRKSTDIHTDMTMHEVHQAEVKQYDTEYDWAFLCLPSVIKGRM